MAVYLVTGKLGSGKTLACVGKIRDALRDGKKVITNLDIDMAGLATRDDSHKFVYRLSDYPTMAELRAMGRGQEGYDEKDNGLAVFDECGAWLNTREWQSAGERQQFIDWMLHSRKLGWDVLLIVQDISIIDKQIRTALVEFLVTCKRADRLAVPFITPFLKLFGLNLRPPKIHLGLVKYGTDPQAPTSDRWVYMARDLYKAYDTKQIFRPCATINGVEIPAVGLSCTLSRWHLVGRYQAGKRPLLEQLRQAARVAAKLPLAACWWPYVQFGGGSWDDLGGPVVSPKRELSSVDWMTLTPEQYHPLSWYYRDTPTALRESAAR